MFLLDSRILLFGFPAIITFDRRVIFYIGVQKKSQAPNFPNLT